MVRPPPFQFPEKVGRLRSQGKKIGVIAIYADKDE